MTTGKLAEARAAPLSLLVPLLSLPLLAKLAFLSFRLQVKDKEPETYSNVATTGV